MQKDGYLRDNDESGFYGKMISFHGRNKESLRQKANSNYKERTEASVEDALVKCDILVVGGGLGGCMAAIKASEHDVKVTLVEKANAKRSGVLEQETTIFGVTFLGFTSAFDLVSTSVLPEVSR